MKKWKLYKINEAWAQPISNQQVTDWSYV